MCSPTLRRFHRSAPARALAVLFAIAPVVLNPLPSSAGGIHQLRPAEASFDELLIQAEDKRTAGAYAESAALYGQAYRARPEAERADQIGEITIRNAMADYDLAWASKPDLALLEAQARLLEGFIAARKQAQANARAEGAGKVPDVPQDLVDELTNLDRRIAELREAERRPAEEQQEPEVEQEPEPRVTPEPKPEPTTSPKLDAAILGVGLASLVGGIGLIAGGAWNFSKTEEHVDTQLAALDAEPLYTEEQRQTYREDLDQWRGQWRGVATGLVVGGAVLAAAGAGLASWGIVRMRKHRATRTRATLAPDVARRHVGGVLTVVF